MSTPAASSRWRVLIVDDEPLARQSLRLLIARHPDFDLVGECSHGQEAIDAVRRSVPDLLFLDIQMPGMDGFDVLREIGPTVVPAIVFATAYDEYALCAFESRALDYLLKPYSDERFEAVLGRVRERLRERSFASMGERLADLLGSRRASTLVVRDGSRTIAIPHGDIVWIEAEDYYARVHARTGRTLVRVSLRALAASLDPERFVRVHRSAIVNVDSVREMQPLASGDQRLLLADGTALRVSRTYRASLDALLGRR